ncbi:hypothetical protein [Streptomyces boluensis]|uniref:hypothetical protein n=1 Tax=Streptomyces boluensis TaxID=1775135 RepID=UPI0016522BC5|nr:hypothetical protein [Streptomyces boluensis]
MAKTPTRPHKAGSTGRLLLVAATLTGLAAVPAAAAVTAPDTTTRTSSTHQAQKAPEAPEVSEALEAPAASRAPETRTAQTAAEPGAAEPRAAEPGAAEPRKQPAAAAAPARDGSPGSVYERVAHFYAAYVDVANDPGDNAAAAELRKFYLTPELRSRLLTWEQHHEADGVLMAQNVPSAWKVTSGDSGMGHTWSTVRLTWGTGQDRTYTYLKVQSDLATRKISDIRSKY